MVAIEQVHIYQLLLSVFIRVKDVILRKSPLKSWWQERYFVQTISVQL